MATQSNKSTRELHGIKEERKAQVEDAIKVWWHSVISDPRFQMIVDATDSRRPLADRIQDTPHAQHVADGFRQGFASRIEIMKSLPFEKSHSAEQNAAELMQTQDPDLNDDTIDTASRRFGRK